MKYTFSLPFTKTNQDKLQLHALKRATRITKIDNKGKSPNRLQPDPTGELIYWLQIRLSSECQKQWYWHTSIQALKQVHHILNVIILKFQVSELISIGWYSHDIIQWDKYSHAYNLKCFGSSSLQNIPCLLRSPYCDQLEFGNQPVSIFKKFQSTIFVNIT